MVSRQPRSDSARCVVTFAVVYLALGHSVPVLLGLGGVLLFGLAYLVPVRVLVSASLLGFVVVPFHYLGLHQPLDAFPPPTLLLMAAVLAVLLRPTIESSPGSSRTLVLFGSAFVVYTAVIGFASGYSNARHAATWTILSAFMLVVVPVVVGRTNGARSLVTTWRAVSVVLAVAAVVEYATRSNPLTSLYAHSADDLTESWGVYRVFTTLGHPLVNGTFFAISLTLAVAHLVRHPNWRGLGAIPVLGAAVFLTASRGAFLAAVAGTAAVLLISVFQRGNGAAKLRSILLVVGAAAVVTVVGSSTVLAHRNASAEGESSSLLRDRIFHLLPSMLHLSHYMGSGADTSYAVWQAVAGFYAQYPLENSLAQFIVDYGVVGSLLYLAFLLAVLVPGLRAGAIYGPAGLVAYAFAATGFNLFEAYAGALILPSLLLALTAMEARAGSAAPAIESEPLRPGVAVPGARRRVDVVAET